MSSWISRNVRRSPADDLVVVDQQHLDCVSHRGPPSRSWCPCRAPIHCEPPADAARPVVHRDQAEVASRAAYRLPGSKPLAVVADVSTAPAPRLSSVTSRRTPRSAAVRCAAPPGRRGASPPPGPQGRARMPSQQNVTRAPWARSSTWICAYGGWRPEPSSSSAAGRNSTTAARSSSGGLRGERGHVLQLVAGAGRIAVHELRRRLRGQAEREELLADGVVAVRARGGALLGDGELAAALVEPGVRQGRSRRAGRGSGAAPRPPA